MTRHGLVHPLFVLITVSANRQVATDAGQILPIHVRNQTRSQTLEEHGSSAGGGGGGDAVAASSDPIEPSDVVQDVRNPSEAARTPRCPAVPPFPAFKVTVVPGSLIKASQRHQRSEFKWAEIPTPGSEGDHAAPRQLARTRKKAVMPRKETGAPRKQRCPDRQTECVKQERCFQESWNVFG